MLIRCLLLVLFINCVCSTKYIYEHGLERKAKEYNQFSFWPSLPNAARIFRLRKRQVQAQDQIPIGHAPIVSEGGTDGSPAADGKKEPAVQNDQAPSVNKPTGKDEKVEKELHTDLNTKETVDKSQNVNQTSKEPPNTAGTVAITPVTANDTSTNTTVLSSATPNHLDINNPGVLMRGVIVFGGFLVIGVAYFLFYRTRTNKNEVNSKHNLNDLNQFRYGVLESDDRRDNLELSRVPLTMETDDEDDEDLEIFDLEQKKKSLSYVNLQQHDEDLVFEDSRTVDTDNIDNLLLDIEEGPSDTLINWTNNSGGNKSIL